MKKLTIIFSFWMLAMISMAQTPPVRLHVQASKAELAGDGDDYTTIVVTARDPEGEIITSMNGKVTLRCSSGFLDESELQMNNGIAYTKYTAPIFGQPIKAAQRMVYFMVKFIRKFLSRFGGSTDMESNQKLAGNIALETFKEGYNPLTLMPQKDGDNNVYFVCEMNGIKGKTEVKIVKTTEGGNSAILPGYYSGYDITGQAPFELVLESGGKGQMTQGGIEPVSILFTNEQSAEINGAMQKMMGGGEWMNAYVGASERDQQYMEGSYDIRKNGLPSIYLPMPNNGIFMYIPPILFEYQGKPKVDPSGSGTGTNEEAEKKPRVFVTIEQNELIGDGRCRTKALFHYEDENKIPVAGKSFTWSIPKDIKIISSQTVTDASGNAIAIIQMPLIKATEEKRGDMWGQIIDNTQLYRISTNFSTPKSNNESAYIDFAVYKTIEKNMRILKPGFESAPIKVLLPQVEQYTLQGNIFAMVEMANSPSIPEKMNVSDAIVFVERQKFDIDYFNRNFETCFKKDRQTFINLLDDKKGGFMAITDNSGNFKVKIGGGSDRVFVIDSLQSKISFLNVKRQKALTDVLNLFEDPAFSNQVIEKLFAMNKDLCTQEHEKCVYLEEKLHVIGTIMTNTNGTARYMKDCAKNFSQQSYEAFKYLFFLAAEKFKWNDKLGKWFSDTKVGGKLVDAGITMDKYFWNDIAGQDAANGTKSIILKFMYSNLTDQKVLASQTYYKLMGSTANWVLVKKEKKMMDAIAGNISKFLDAPDMFIGMFIGMYYSDQKEEIMKLLNQDPVKIDAVYEALQPALVDRSTEIRQHYMDIASWRLDLEMFKAYKDLFTELVIKGGIIIVDAATGNYASMKSHLDMLSNVHKALDAAYIASRLVIEFQNYRNLWAESDAALIYANKCIDQGTLNPVTQNSPPDIYLFLSAVAADPSSNGLRGVPAIETGKLKLTNGNLPSAELTRIYNGYPDYQNWLEENEEKLIWLSLTSPDEYSKLIKAGDNYDRNLECLTIATLGIAEDPGNDQIKNDWTKYAEELKSSSDQLIQNAAKAGELMKEMPVNPKLEKAQSNEVSVFKNKTLIYAGTAVAGIAVILIVIFFIRKKSKKHKPAEATIVTPPIQNLPANPPVITRQVPQVKEPEKQELKVLPKFCPKCGAPFKSGAKFCGKCGYKP